jgi:hypothetical protein
MVTLAHGPRSLTGPPWDLIAEDVPCRLVPQYHIYQDQFPFDLSTQWMTIDEYAPTGPMIWTNAIGIVYTDYLAADMVIQQDPSFRRYMVCRREELLGVEVGPYWRYLLIPLLWFSDPQWLPRSPLPPAPPPAEYPPVPPPGTSPPPAAGGSTCSTAIAVTYGQEFGVLLSGTVGEVQWRYCDVPPGASRILSNAAAVSGSLAVELSPSASCGSQSWVTVSAACQVVSVPASYRLYLRVTQLVVGSYTLTTRIDGGSC